MRMLRGDDDDVDGNDEDISYSHLGACGMAFRHGCTEISPTDSLANLIPLIISRERKCQWLRTVNNDTTTYCLLTFDIYPFTVCSL